MTVRARTHWSIPGWVHTLRKAVVTLIVMIAAAGILRVAPAGLDEVLLGAGAVVIALAFNNAIKDIGRAPIISAFGLGVLILFAYSVVGYYVFPPLASLYWVMFGIIATVFIMRWSQSSSTAKT